eukprot:TRINITY_DN1960_c0_g1_i2.p1 TRINITY_DN1960_c0_g1~~TRINITY_DN1960_c0_g1_i2.p1  ORF type:complete len:198 (+),score=51.71 TRINITY_DN1960_c0_g1_i2:36-596(+)
MSLTRGFINLLNNQKKSPINLSLLYNQLEYLKKKTKTEQYDISLEIVTNEEIKKFNKDHRNVDKPTDVLSVLCTDQEFTPPTLPPPENGVYDLGDILISAEYVEKYAKDNQLEYTDHMTRMVVHGFCHLLGYTHDHDHDWRRMRAKEGWLRKFLKNKFKKDRHDFVFNNNFRSSLSDEEIKNRYKV